MDTTLPSHVIEQFHLLFLAHLTRGADKRAIVVKGGCNLRFFHRSIRYRRTWTSMSPASRNTPCVTASGTSLHPARLASARGARHRDRARDRAQADADRAALEVRPDKRPARPAAADENRVLPPRPGRGRGVRKSRPGTHRPAQADTVHGQSLRGGCRTASEGPGTGSSDRNPGTRCLRRASPDCSPAPLATALRVSSRDDLSRPARGRPALTSTSSRARCCRISPAKMHHRYGSEDVWDTMVLEVLEALDGETK